MINIDTLKYSHGNQDGDTFITITEGPFEGITYKYGRTWFPDEDEPVLSFEYDIIAASKKYDKIEFEKEIGVILHELLRKAVADQSVVYSGGTGPYIEESNDNPD